MPFFAVTSVGPDRAGIVACITGPLKEAECNVEDCTMSLLCGHSALMLIVSAPVEVTAAQLQRSLNERCAHDFQLQIHVSELDEDQIVHSSHVVGAAQWRVQVLGSDRPGVLHVAARVLADAGINIIDLHGRVRHSRAAENLGIVMCIAPVEDPEELKERLQAVEADLPVQCDLYPPESERPVEEGL